MRLSSPPYPATEKPLCYCGTPFLIERIRTTPEPKTKIRQNSTFLKILACTPLIGDIVHYSVIITLRKKIAKIDPSKHQEIADLIHVKNSFNKCGVFRNVLSIALIITLFALVIIFPLAIPGALITSANVFFLFNGLALISTVDAIKQNQKRLLREERDL